MAAVPADSNIRYFVAKCGGMDSLRRCVRTKKWASRERVFSPQPHEVLTSAFSQGPVVLIFSVNNCHGWHGYCYMSSAPVCPVAGTTSAGNEALGGHQQGTVNPCGETTAETKKRKERETEMTSAFKEKQNTDIIHSDCTEKPSVLTEEKQMLTDEISVANALTDSTTGCSATHTAGEVSSQSVIPSGEGLADNQTLSDNSETSGTDKWHYFHVEWQIDFITNFGETCLPSSKTANLFLPDGTPLNKARNWQEISDGGGSQVCVLLDEMYASLIEKRKRQEAAKLAAKLPPFMHVEGDFQEEAEQYWRCIVDKVERELGCVHLACPFGSQRYNLQQPQSDIDAFIVYQAHTKDLLGFNPPKMTVKNSEREACDYTVLELKRYCELLLAHDARCIETLFLDDSTLVQASAEWRQLQEFRQQFLTRKCLDKYLGDALGSNGVQKLQRCLENNPVSGDQPPSPRVAKLAYIIIRLLQNAVDIVKGEPLNVFRPEGSAERDILLKIRKENITLDEINSVIQRLQEEIDQQKDTLIKEQPSTKKCLESWLLSLRSQDFQAHPPSE